MSEGMMAQLIEVLLEAEQDIIRSYDLHANCYITKPVDFEQFITAMREVNGFWLGVVRLPAA